MHRLRLVPVFALLVTLLGCTVELPPIASASVTHYKPGTPQPSRLLSSQAQAKVGHWFSEHRTGWSRSYATYAPATELRIEGKSREVIVVNLVGRKVVTYGSFGQFEQSFETAEAMSELLSAAGENGG